MSVEGKRSTVLLILDGWGVAQPSASNAAHLARTPVLDELTANYPCTRLAASGEAVGLPTGQMGNSEVGHLNLGAGRIVYQDFTRISKAIQEGSFQSNPALCKAIEVVRERNAALHLMGLVSDGGVHSHLDHLFALVRMARDQGCRSVQIHAILDGRDTPPTSGIDYMGQLERSLNEAGIGRVATIMGRFWGMDRDGRWERIEKAYRALTMGEGRFNSSALAAVQWGYEHGETDEFIEPTIIGEMEDRAAGRIGEGDGVIFFNFRADRAREITRALTEPQFRGFGRPFFLRLSAFVCMTQYDETFPLPVAFPPVRVRQTLGEVLANHGLRQLRIAETEKYAHVTYFFNGGEEAPFPLEDRCLIPSPRDVPTYDLKPEMSASEIAEEALRRIHSGIYDFIVLNFANGDMVGHTGVLAAAIRACEALDACVGRIVEALLNREGRVMITGDHGNVEQMHEDEDHEPHTAHTSNFVPCVLVDPERRGAALREGILADVAPTLLEVMGIPVPVEMTGRSLLEG